ncbi:MAG: hypothetical protein ABW321_13790 [Polyangiales bacterium]
MLGAAVSGVLVSTASRAAARRLRGAPKLISVTGGVAVGKSTFARMLRRTLMRKHGQRVEVVSTDGFLRSDADLERCGLLQRKGFPESYDHAALADFFAALREPCAQLSVPVYCHRARGCVGQHTFTRPDWLIVEGVYAQQPARACRLDSFAIFLEADRALIQRWYVQRFLRVHGARFADEQQAVRRALQLDAEVNYANYRCHIAPLRSAADLVLHKQAEHTLHLSARLAGITPRASEATLQLGMPL